MASSSEKGVNRYLTGGALVLLLLIVGYAFFSGGGILGGKFVAASGEECTNSIELQLSDTGRFVLREEGQTFSSANVGWASSYSCADDGICTQGETGFDALIDDALEEARDPSNGFEDSIVYNCIKYDGLFYKSGSSAGGGPPADDGGGDRDGGDSGGTAGGGGVSADSSPQEEPEIDWLDTSAADDWFIFKNSDGNGVLWFLNQMANGMWVIMQLAFAEGGGPQTLDPGSASGLGLDSLDGLLPGGQFPDSESSSTMLSNVKSLVAPNGADSSGTDKSSLNDQLKLCGCEYKSELGWSGTENEGSRTCGSWRDTPTYCSQNSNYCTWTCNDADGDGVCDSSDSCPGQEDLGTDADGDGTDDACDTDNDNDGVLDEGTSGEYCRKSFRPNSIGFTNYNGYEGYRGSCSDNCPLTANDDQRDFDGDGIGDACDTDDDADGVSDANDECLGVLVSSGSNVRDSDCIQNSINNRLNYDCPELLDAGQEVASDGCLDTDFDGVSDNNDECADTVEGAVVDATGCPECQTILDCNDGFLCNEKQACELFPAECTDDSACGANFACGGSSNYNKCYTSCTQDSQCTDGFGCYGNECLTSCTDDSDCSEGTKCSGYPSNVCVDTSGFCRESREIRLGPSRVSNTFYDKILVEPNSGKYDRSENTPEYGSVWSGVLSSHPDDPVSGCIGVSNSHKYKVGLTTGLYGGPTSNSLFYQGTYCPLYGGGSNDQYSQTTCTSDSECTSGYICTPFYSTGESRCVSVKTGKDTCEREGQSWYSGCMWVGADCADIDTYDSTTGDWSSNKILCESYGCAFYEASCGVISGAPEEYIATCSAANSKESCSLISSNCLWKDYNLPWVGCYGGSSCSAIPDSATCEGTGEVASAGCEWITQ